MRPYFSGSHAERRLKKVCRLLGVEPSEKFYGFTAGRRRILYRCAQAWLAKTSSGNCWRWKWKNPFGSSTNRREVDFVMLHGPEAGPFEERFFIFPVREAERLARAWPTLFDLPANPDARMRGGRSKIWEREATTREAKRILG